MGNKLEREQLIKGVWDKDIDKYPLDEYTFESTCGYICEIKRNNNWIYCGYVQLPENHPDFDKEYNDIQDIHVHGDLTFGENGKFGFDCGHILKGDISPQDETLKITNPMESTVLTSLHGNECYHYWTFDEVKNELENLANQFKCNSQKLNNLFLF